MRDNTVGTACYRLELLRGGYPVKRPNTIFWIVLGILIAQGFHFMSGFQTPNYPQEEKKK
jgi:hypothetical protein